MKRIEIHLDDNDFEALKNIQKKVHKKSINYKRKKWTSKLSSILKYIINMGIDEFDIDEYIESRDDVSNSTEIVYNWRERKHEK